MSFDSVTLWHPTGLALSVHITVTTISITINIFCFIYVNIWLLIGLILRSTKFQICCVLGFSFFSFVHFFFSILLLYILYKHFLTWYKPQNTLAHTIYNFRCLGEVLYKYLCSCVICVLLKYINEYIQSN